MGVGNPFQHCFMSLNAGAYVLGATPNATWTGKEARTRVVYIYVYIKISQIDMCRGQHLMLHGWGE